MATLESWLREHPGVEVVCRDGSATYAEAVRRALPDAVQVSDRWHLWRNLCDKALLEIRAHAGCWATINPPRPGGVREQSTRERWNKIHELLGQGAGLLDCSRRLNLALNTVKRYARMPEPQALRIAPAYRPTLVDPYREHLRRRRAEETAVPVTHLLKEIRELGYTGSANLLVRCYLNQGRAEGDRPVTTARHAGRLRLTDPENLHPKETTLLEKIAAACPEMKSTGLPWTPASCCPTTTAAPRASTPAPKGSCGRCTDASESISSSTASSCPDGHPASPPTTGQTR